MVGAARECEDGQLEGVEGREAEQRGVGGALGDGGAVEAVEVVADEDVAGAQPGDEVSVCLLEGRAAIPLPEAFFSVSARGNGVEYAVASELDVEEEKRQKRPRELATSGSGENCNGQRRFLRAFLPNRGRLDGPSPTFQ